MKLIVVSGAIANKSFNGGEAWVRLNWVRGFQNLGYDVLFVEQIGKDTCRNEGGANCDFESSANLSFFQRVMSDFGLANSSSLVYENGNQVFGIPLAELVDMAASAELLVNISGHLRLESILEGPEHVAYVDLDPGFTQFWHASGVTDMALECHDSFFTIGENIGTSRCSIPTSGLNWQPIRQPVVLDDWPLVSTASPGRFTTIASWRGSYGATEFQGKKYGSKAHEFRKFVDFPTLVEQECEIALDIHAADHKDLDLLEQHRWRVIPPRNVSSDPLAFRTYVQESGAEFSVAQGIYVDTCSGWFSDRTVRYLASGKPALVQDTGFSDHLPTGEGLFAFRTLIEAVEAARAIAADYEAHVSAARAVAEAFFNSDMVLGRLLESLGITN